MTGHDKNNPPPKKIRKIDGASFSMDDPIKQHDYDFGASYTGTHVSKLLQIQQHIEKQKRAKYNAFNNALNQEPLLPAQNEPTQVSDMLGFKDSIVYIAKRIKNYKETIVKTLRSINERARFLAEKLNDNRVIFYLYAIFDSLSLSYSFIKYLFDVILESNNSYSMHHLMLTPAGIASIVLSSCYLIAYSLFNTYFGPEKVKSWRKNMADLWPYVRDIIQALKNGYKGMRSVIRVVAKFAHDNIQCAILPLALTLGLVTVLNRLWLRYMRNERKELMSINLALVEAINSKNALPWLKIHKPKWAGIIKKLGLTDVDDENWLEKLKAVRDRLTENDRARLDKLDEVVQAIQADTLNLNALNALTNSIVYHTITAQFIINCMSIFFEENQVDSILRNTKKLISYLSVTLNGVMDGAYLYLGVLGVASLVPPALIAMLALCAVYTALSITARLYEEHGYQVKLHITQTQGELAILERQLNAKYLEFHNELDEIEKARIRAEYNTLLAQFNEKTKLLREQSTVGYFGAVLSGINIGLGLYSAVVSIILLVGTILSLSAIAFPPALLIACISLGIGCLLASVAYSLIAHYIEYGSENLEVPDISEDILLSDQATHKKELSKASHYVAPASSVLPSYIELLRSFFSGFGKGQKTVDYALNPFQEADSHGDFRDPKWMYWVGVSMGVVNGVILSLRSFAKELGGDKLRFNLKIKYTEVVSDELIQKNTVYLYAHNNKIMYVLKDRAGLIQRVEFTRQDIQEKLDCFMYDNIYSVLTDPARNAQLSDKEREEIIAAAWKKGYIVEPKLENEERRLDEADDVEVPEPKPNSALLSNSWFARNKKPTQDKTLNNAVDETFDNAVIDGFDI